MDDGRAKVKYARLLVWMLCAASCASRGPHLDSFPTKEAAAQAVASALASGDVSRLEALAVTREQFRRYVWPELPASQPEVGMPFEYLWADTSAKSRGYLARVVRDHAGASLTVESVRFGGDAVAYPSFRIHPKSHVRVRTSSGEIQDLRLFGSMIEFEGRWKVLSFIID